MAGDAQMHPDDLASLVSPVARGEVDYAKGDRMSHEDVRRIMPTTRYVAGRALSWLTREAIGLDRLSDSQCGYTAIAARALDAIPLDTLWPRYGYPNDLLGLVAAAGLRVRDVPVRPVYAGEASGVRPWHVARILWILARLARGRVSQSARARSTMASA
jgi:hypothetical protein